MTKKFLNIKLMAVCCGFVMCLALLGNEECHGYIMPAEQLIEFMTKNFSKVKTVVVTHSTLKEDQGTEKVFKEQIRMKAPDLFQMKPLDNVEDRGTFPDMSYRQLLIANSASRIEEVLTMMGIDLHTVSLTRIDGIIAYRIGEKGPEGPQLLIEKERFLPLLLVYRPPGDPSGEMITVRFDDYREVDKGWYPFEITYSPGGDGREEYSALDVQANVPLDSLPQQPFKVESSQNRAPEKGAPDVEEERLKKIIKAFEGKYR